MNNFYTIISFSPNVATQDSLAIGLLLYDGIEFRTYFSENKIKISQKLLQDKNINLKHLTKQIINKSIDLNLELSEKKLFNNSSKWTDSSYFDYLNRYSNGIIRFSKPKLFLESNKSDSFNNLVEFLFPNKEESRAFLDEIELSSKEKIKIIIQNKLINRVSNKIHTNYKFTSEKFPSLHFDYEMDCIGLNGSLIGAKSLEFNQSVATLDLKLSHYYSLIPFLSNKYNKALKDNNFYLITEEPKVIDSKEHKLWEAVKRNELVEVINPEQSEKVVNKIDEKNASKFLDKI